MPTYEYKCRKCSRMFDAFQSIVSKPVRKCPECGARTVDRLIGTGSALIFKGDGFYCNDYPARTRGKKQP